MRFNCLLDDGQTQPGAGNHTDILCTMKHFKHAFLVFLRNADALILNGDGNFLMVAGQGEVNRSAARGVFNGVRQQVNKRLLDQFFIHQHCSAFVLTFKMNLMARGSQLGFVHQTFA